MGLLFYRYFSFAVVVVVVVVAVVVILSVVVIVWVWVRLFFPLKRPPAHTHTQTHTHTQKRDNQQTSKHHNKNTQKRRTQYDSRTIQGATQIARSFSKGPRASSWYCEMSSRTTTAAAEIWGGASMSVLQRKSEQCPIGVMRQYCRDELNMTDIVEWDTSGFVFPVTSREVAFGVYIFGFTVPYRRGVSRDTRFAGRPCRQLKYILQLGMIMMITITMTLSPCLCSSMTITSVLGDVF